MKPIYIYFWRLRKRYLVLSLIVITLLVMAYANVTNRMAMTSIDAMSWSLANKVIVVDPGHGGIDPGAKGVTGLEEKEVTLAVAKKLKMLLSQAGAVVIMTRETDTDLSDPGLSGYTARKRQDLKLRAKIANDKKADVYIAIHGNSFPQSQYRGAQVFYQRGSEPSKFLADSIQAEFIETLKNTDRVAKEDTFITIRETKMPAVIAEIGFLSNSQEEKLLKDPAYQEEVAWSVYAGLVKYFVESAEQKE